MSEVENNSVGVSSETDEDYHEIVPMILRN